MALRRLMQLGTPLSFVGSSMFTVELSPLQGSITELFLMLRTDVTTTTETPFSDYWDRIINTVGLTHGDGSMLSVINYPALYHFTRLVKRMTTKRPTVLGNSVTNGLTTIGLCLHFGMQPRLPNGEWNPFDLSAGVPYIFNDKITLSGTWAAAAGSLGTNDTVNVGTRLDVLAHVVQPEGNEDARNYQPQWIPNWFQRQPTPVATSSAFASQDNEQSGDFLRSMLVQVRRGANLARVNDSLSSLEVYDQVASRSIIRLGGQSETAAAGEEAEIIMQIGSNGWPPTETPAAAGGVPAVTAQDDAGLIPLQLWRYSDGAHPLAGIDLRHQPDGAIITRVGVLNATALELSKTYEKYKPNMLHPDTAAWVAQNP